MNKEDHNKTIITKKKKNLLILLFAFSIYQSFAQDNYFTRSGTLSFFSATPMENIEAKNSQTSCILNTSTGEIAVSAQMKGFEFEKALMQEHFNENYVESHKYPKATFKGKIVDFSPESISESAKEVKIEGILNVHGVDKEISTTATISKKDDAYDAVSKFKVAASDFDIKIPKAVINNIAKEIEVSINLQLEPYVQ